MDMQRMDNAREATAFIKKTIEVKKKAEEQDVPLVFVDMLTNADRAQSIEVDLALQLVALSEAQAAIANMQDPGIDEKDIVSTLENADGAKSPEDDLTPEALARSEAETTTGMLQGPGVEEITPVPSETPVALYNPIASLNVSPAAYDSGSYNSSSYDGPCNSTYVVHNLSGSTLPSQVSQNPLGSVWISAPLDLFASAAVSETFTSQHKPTLKHLKKLAYQY
ncbi:hypothetical protein BDQ17DRAFT_676013 [Cyathus striatus]|nr:hypothetical protein BDQ17DRAFT_676013 [Cyathus striatus]